MSKPTTINFGAIRGRRCVTFRVSEDGHVLPKKFVHLAEEEIDRTLFITARESFRRWKVARKAWQTRKNRNQLQLGFNPPE
jgi:hypothetical protein